jgi:hypothetical protein
MNVLYLIWREPRQVHMRLPSNRLWVALSENLDSRIPLSRREAHAPRSLPNERPDKSALPFIQRAAVPEGVQSGDKFSGFHEPGSIFAGLAPLDQRHR